MYRNFTKAVSLFPSLTSLDLTHYRLDGDLNAPAPRSLRELKLPTYSMGLLNPSFRDLTYITSLSISASRAVRGEMALELLFQSLTQLSLFLDTSDFETIIAGLYLPAMESLELIFAAEPPYSHVSINCLSTFLVTHQTKLKKLVLRNQCHTSVTSLMWTALLTPSYVSLKSLGIFMSSIDRKEVIALLKRCPESIRLDLEFQHESDLFDRIESMVGDPLTNAVQSLWMLSPLRRNSRLPELLSMSPHNPSIYFLDAVSLAILPAFLPLPISLALRKLSFSDVDDFDWCDILKALPSFVNLSELIISFDQDVSLKSQHLYSFVLSRLNLLEWHNRRTKTQVSCVPLLVSFLGCIPHLRSLIVADGIEEDYQELISRLSEIQCLETVELNVKQLNDSVKELQSTAKRGWAIWNVRAM